VALKGFSKNRLYYSISEVSRVLGVEPHVLRYWEQEFPPLRPPKNRAGNRTYREKDVRTAMLIKHLLKTEGYTVDGARRKLAAIASNGQLEMAFREVSLKELLDEVKTGLREVIELLG
jgi:DNA-binding transcriptional MerR regulator